MVKIIEGEKKWEQRWHDSTIDNIDSMLRSFRKSLSVETNKGTAHGADIIVSTTSEPVRKINIEVQMHPSGHHFVGTMDKWAHRHSQAIATFIVCPTALVATMAKRIESHRALGPADRVFLFGDTEHYLTLVCASAFAMLQSP